VRMEEGAIRTSGEGVSTREAEHGMIDYIQHEIENERNWLMGIVGMKERPCIKDRGLEIVVEIKKMESFNDGRRVVLLICEWGRDAREPGP